MTSPTTTTDLKICIVNCYPEASRANFDKQEVGHPHDMFMDFLSSEAPNASVDIVYAADPDFGLPDGKSIDDYDGFMWTGSDLIVYKTDDPRVSGQIKFAETLATTDAASWGSCWGLQLASLIGGGEVVLSPNGREWGIARRIELNDAARSAAILAGKPAVFDAFIMHLDEVSQLPDGVTNLGGNDHTSVQVAEFEMGESSFWATQYHPEYNLYEMGRLIAARSEALVREGHFVDVAAVDAYAADMIALYESPDSAELRASVGVGDDIIDPAIRQIELRNWLRFVDARRIAKSGA